jgi:hypothetical protein
MSLRKSPQKSDRATIARVAKEMAEPRKSLSVRNDEKKAEDGKKAKTRDNALST